MKKIYFIYLFSFVFSIFNANAQKIYVTAIADGDSFTALFADMHTEKIRIYGIDCPEYGQPFSALAKKFTSQQIFRKKISLKYKGADQYGRILALVYLPDSSLLNEKLLSAGMAWHYTRYDKNSYWQLLEKTARQKKLGIWSDTQTPIAPWLWRKERKNSVKIIR